MDNAVIIKSGLTKRAPDAGDSGAIPSSFLRLSTFPVGRRSAAHPSAGNANRWATGERYNKLHEIFPSIHLLTNSDFWLY